LVKIRQYSTIAGEPHSTAYDYIEQPVRWYRALGGITYVAKLSRATSKWSQLRGAIPSSWQLGRRL